jgi:hypothetical protein
MRQWGGLEECQSCAMEQVLILALGVFPVKTSIVVSKRVASDAAVRWGITTSTRRKSPARCCASSNTGHRN